MIDKINLIDEIILNKNYDLHLHSCLSPCGEDSMTPATIAGIGKLNALEVMALTDHNTCRNCPAFFEACEFYGIRPLAGMELTTAEDIHIVCLFDELEKALRFNSFVDTKRFLLQNRPDIFGRQLIMNCEDEITGEEENLLPPATMITVDEVYDLTLSFGGIAYPAHIDREANGLIATLGTFPSYLPFEFVELHDKSKKEEYLEKYPALRNKKFIFSSDAHRINEIKNYS